METIDQNFGDDIVYYLLEDGRPKLLKLFGVSTFGVKAIMIERWLGQSSLLKSLVDKVVEIIAHNVSILFEKKALEHLDVVSFEGFHCV